MKLLYRLLCGPLVAMFKMFLALLGLLAAAISPAPDIVNTLNRLLGVAVAFGRDQGARFRAFVDRARSHDLFVSGHFDPGRLRA